MNETAYTIGRRVQLYMRPDNTFIWQEIRPKNPPEIYSEDFRPINPDEGHCIDTCIERSRLNSISYEALNDRGKSTWVSYACDKFGLTLCIIFCQRANHTYINAGMARLNPIDSFDKIKGQKLAFYRAVTGE